MEMTKQDIFNRVCAHLFTQGVASYGEFIRYSTIESDAYEQTGCIYRGPNGTSCAVGCLIPDAQYKKEFEGKTANWVIDQITSDLDHTPAWGAYPDLLHQLQGAHDNYMPRPPGWAYEGDLDDEEPDSNYSLHNVAKELKRIADEHELALPTVVETFLS